MESEKAKEIKKALSCSAGDFYAEPIDCKLCKFSDKGIYSKCKGWKLAKDALTLINELESENERLTKQYVDWKDLYYENTKRVKKLKDRIAELEKKNAKLLDSVETVQNDRCVFKCELTKKQLKQFAERLIEKLKARHEVNRLLLMPVRDIVLSTIEGLLEDVDKTLKELINE